MGASLQVSFFFSFLSFFFFLPLILYHALYCFIFLCFFSSFFSPLFPLPPHRPPLPPPLSLSLISRSIHAYPRLVSTLVRSTHETISECARRYKMGYCPRKQKILISIRPRDTFSFNGVQCNAIYRGKQRTIKSPLWKILALLASELYRLTTKTHFVSKPRNAEYYQGNINIK